MAAGIAGAVIGAGVTAAVTALSDKETRKTVFTTIGNARKRAVDMMENTKDKVESAHPKIDETAEEAEKTVYKMKDDVEEAAKMV